MSANGTFLYPNVTTLPGQGRPVSDQTEVNRGGRNEELDPGEFDRLLKSAEQIGTGIGGVETLGSRVDSPLKFSSHAAQRMQDRKIAFDPEVMARVRDAVDKAAAKGIQDTLVLTGDAAFIVNTKNRTVITAMDKASLNGNVFSNIDGAVLV